jgi:hypothetical protein
MILLLEIFFVVKLLTTLIIPVKFKKLLICFIPNKHFGTKVRTMVRFFVPHWSQSSQQKAFPTENFSKSKKQLSTFHLMIFACQVDIEPDWVRIFSQFGEFFSSLFRCLNIIFYYLGIFINPAKKSRDAVNRNPKNSSFQN